MDITQTCGIYLFTNIVNTKSYVGSSENLAHREYDHRRLLNLGLHPNTYFQAAWNKYGSGAFTYSVVEYCDRDVLMVREDWWITLLGTMARTRGYNLISASRRQISEETRRRMSESHVGRKHSAETRAKMSAAGRGRSRSPETKMKISVSRSGKPLTPAQRAVHSRSVQDRVISQETREKQSASHKGVPWSEARREAENRRLQAKGEHKLSQYVKCGSQFRDEGCLVKALMRAGRWREDQIEVHKEATNLFGWRGDRRADLAHIIVRQQHVGCAANDLGFQKQADGTYTVIISEHERNHNGYNDGWVTRLTDFYNEERVAQECRALGYSYEVEEKNGERQLVAFLVG